MSLAEIVIAVGLTSSGKVIEAQLWHEVPADRRVLIVSGLDGSRENARLLKDEKPERKRFRSTVIANANPDGAPLQFPPPGQAYRDHPESHYLWRFILNDAPDLVVVVGPDPADLTGAITKHVPAVRIEAGKGFLKRIRPPAEPSPLRREMANRLDRSPKQVAEELARVYGYDLNEAVYIPAVALLGRLRLNYLEDVERIVAPYRDGAKDSLAKPTASHFSGHLLFAELYRRTKNPAYQKLVEKAAALAVKQPLHNEMSDWTFMATPLLAEAGRYDDALAQFRFIQKLCLRPDGLYRHSPLDDAAWGRGNAFPALGMAWALERIPESHAAFDEIRRAFQNLMSALATQQDDLGMWRQVIDRPGAYREFSSTSMIAVAMLKGVRLGWLSKQNYEPRIARAWQAVKSRIATDGKLLDVCESTGKQKSLADYLQRKAIFDQDPRGGAMALLFATEMAGNF
jgi:unsaturated rhamnogalacturonyl hydrolase